MAGDLLFCGVSGGPGGPREWEIQYIYIYKYGVAIQSGLLIPPTHCHATMSIYE